MNQLYKFTSSTGRTNYGIVTEQTSNGVYVLLDSFDVSERHTLPTRYAFVSLTPNPYMVNQSATRTLLPLTDDVPWQDERLRTVAGIVQRGEFDGWWQKNAEDVRTKLLQKQE